MPKLSPNYDPFQKETIYTRLDLTAYSPAYEVRAKIEELEGKLSAATEEERSALEALIEEAHNLIDSPGQRVLANILELDPLHSQNIIKQLAQLPDEVRADDLTMQSVDVARILTEGESPEIAAVDFSDVERDSAFETDLETIRDLLRKLPEPRHVSFDS